MVAIHLTATTAEETILKEYLEQNASEVLAEKVNNGIRIEKDGKSLVSKKDLATFLQYANEEARKQAEKDAQFACVKSDTVFGWLIHYMEEDGIEGKLFNEDGTAYAPPKPKYTPKPTTAYTPPAPKPKPQMSFFDVMEQKTEPVTEKPETTPEPTQAAGHEVKRIPDIFDEPEDGEPFPNMRRISDTEYVDGDGVIYGEITQEPTSNESDVIVRMFDGTLESKL
jgi:hypothetical protein